MLAQRRLYSIRLSWIEAMTSTQNLLEIIDDLRQRLIDGQNSIDAQFVSSDRTYRTNDSGDDAVFRDLIQKTKSQSERLHQVLNQAHHSPGQTSRDVVPTRLAMPAARLLLRARDSINTLKQLREAIENSTAISDSIRRTYQHNIHLANLLMRLMHTLPDQASDQIRLCADIEILAGMLEQQISDLASVVHRHQQYESWFRELGALLSLVVRGELQCADGFFQLAEDLVGARCAGTPLTVTSVPAKSAIEFVTGHSLAVALLVTEVCLADSYWRNRILQPVVAALVHDIGMMMVPEQCILHTGPLTAGQRAEIERHCFAGAELLSDIAGAETWLIDAVCNHHERQNGTGYPAGLTGDEVEPMVRLLAVCDIYAALCSHRPYRAAMDGPTALETIEEMSKRGELAADSVTMLHRLGAYPPGAVVELADGSIATVVAPPRNGNAQHVAQPIVAVMRSSDGNALLSPRILDLATADIEIVRQILTGN